MAWVESFEVHGLAGRGDPIVRNLDRRLNIFWGLNGAGKTTLLKILHSAMENDSSSLDELPFESARIVLRYGPDNLRIARSYSKGADRDDSNDEPEEVLLLSEVELNEGWLLDSDSDSRWETQLDSESVPPGRLPGKLAHTYLPLTRVSDSASKSVSSFEAGRRKPEELFANRIRSRWRDYSVRSLARIRDIQQQGLAEVLSILFGGVSGSGEERDPRIDVEPDEAYSTVRRFLQDQGIGLKQRGDFIERFKGSPEHRAVVAEIQDVQLKIEDALAPQQEFQRIIDSMYQGNKHLIVTAPKSVRGGIGVAPIKVEVEDRTIPLGALSSGEKQVLHILLEVLGAGQNTVMVDEPELSLHVDWQQTLVRSMMRVNNDCQLLLASHSPEIVAEAPGECVFEL